MITAKINCTKITKSRLFKGKDGAMYLDIVLLPSPNDKYGNDYMVIESITKEEREKGMKGVILGNGKNIGGGSTPQTGNSNYTPPAVNTDDLPF